MWTMSCLTFPWFNDSSDSLTTAPRPILRIDRGGVSGAPAVRLEARPTLLSRSVIGVKMPSGTPRGGEWLWSHSSCTLNGSCRKRSRSVILNTVFHRLNATSARVGCLFVAENISHVVNVNEMSEGWGKHLNFSLSGCLNIKVEEKPYGFSLSRGVCVIPFDISQ